MDNQRNRNGFLTLLEHWWFLIAAAFAFLISQIFDFLSTLSGTPWVWTYAIGLAIGVGGAALIFHAKLPLYRQRRFFTFGTQALPEHSRPFYRWGYRCVTFAVALMLCLLLSH